MNDQPALFRYTDPDTSRQAARSLQTAALESLILGLFEEHGPMTDDELVALVPDRHPPTVKSARSRLYKAGALVNSGERRWSDRRRAMIVWQLTA